MDTLVISDTHLGRRFSKRKYRYLERLFKKYDRIIINGDFWDHYSFTFNDFLSSKWKGLFPHIKGKTVYMYGNHDKSKWCDKRANRFSTQQKNQHKLKIGNKIFIFRHGHKIKEFRQHEGDMFVKFIRIFRINFIALVLDVLSTKVVRRDNTKVKKFAKSLKSNEFLVIGHLHKPSINMKNKYASGGYVMFNKSKYLEINNEGKIRIVEEKY